MLDSNPILVVLFQIAATLFIVVAISKALGAELDRTSMIILVGLSIILGYYLFQLVEMLAVIFLTLLLVGMWRRSKEAYPGPFVAPESGEEGLDER